MHLWVRKGREVWWVPDLVPQELRLCRRPTLDLRASVSSCLLLNPTPVRGTGGLPVPGESTSQPNMTAQRETEPKFYLRT